MNGVNWFGVMVAVVSLGVFLWVYRRALKMTFKKRVFFFLLASVLAIPGASFTIYYLHLFPETAWYFEFRSLLGIELVLVFVAIAGGYGAALVPKVIRTIPLAGVVILTTLPHWKPIIRPILDEQFDHQWKDEVCMQSTSSTCGPASTCTILKSLGGTVVEKEIAREAHSYAGGTEAWYLARSIRKRGFEVAFKTTEGLDEAINFPAVTGVVLGGGAGHFIPILGREGDQFVIGDPLVKREIISREELLKRYEFTGFYMEIKKSE